MKYAIAMLLVGGVMVRSASAEIIITTDTTLDFFIGLREGPVIIRDGPAGPTTVDIVDGANIQPGVIAKERSVLNLRGGITERGVGGNDQSTINIFGGLVGGEDVVVRGQSTANIYGGIFGDDISAEDSAVVNLYGGTFEKAGNGASLGVSEDGVINVFGSNFVIDPDPPGSPLPRLQGVLSDGSPLDVFLNIFDANSGITQIVLHEIPEPSAFCLCSIGLFLLLVYRRPLREGRDDSF
ncbi:MAG: hypothetical protein IID44_24490 [Planctomycetes bacterium]|nr:hypothetical protein [Planctomycetota bacterium]